MIKDCPLGPRTHISAVVGDSAITAKFTHHSPKNPRNSVPTQLPTNGDLDARRSQVLKVRVQTFGIPMWLSLSVYSKWTSTGQGSIPEMFLIKLNRKNANFCLFPPFTPKIFWSCELGLGLAVLFALAGSFYRVGLYVWCLHATRRLTTLSFEWIFHSRVM